jgi:hypothetical protein
MSLTGGTRLGSYEILAPIGAGGMGEVYRARDTKLERDVAIKILPEALAHDPERLARFEREAKVLASLNHPNIAAIYAVEDRALIMELVEGLREPLVRDFIESGASAATSEASTTATEAGSASVSPGLRPSGDGDCCGSGATASVSVAFSIKSRNWLPKGSPMAAGANLV